MVRNYEFKSVNLFMCIKYTFVGSNGEQEIVVNDRNERN